MEKRDDNPLNMLNESTSGPQGEIENREEVKLDTPFNVIDDMLSYSIKAYSECKFYQIFTKKALKRIIKNAQLNKNPEGVSIGLSNLKNEVVEISQSLTQYVTPLTKIDLIKIDAREELTIRLIEKGVIKIDLQKGKSHGKETITVKASINVKQ